MSISFECTSCQARYRVAGHLAGKRVKCKTCDSPIDIPGEPLPEPEIEIRLKPDVEEPRPAPKLVIPPPLPFPDFRAPTAPVSEPSPAVIVVPPPPAFSLPGQRGSRQRLARNSRTLVTRNGEPIRPCTAGPEGVSSLLVLLYVLVELTAAIIGCNRDHVVGQRVWTLAAVDLACFFIVLVPMVWVGLVCASKLCRFELAEPAYIKAAAIVISPILLIVLQHSFDWQPAAKVGLVLGIIPLTWFLTSMLFSLRAGETTVTYFLGIIGFIIGRVMHDIVMWAILLGSLSSIEKMRVLESRDKMVAYLIALPPEARPGTENDDHSQPQNVLPPSIYTQNPGNTDYIVQELDRIEQQLKSLNRDDLASSMSREQMLSQLKSLQATAENLRLKCTTDSRRDKFQELASAFSDASGRLNSLASARPDDSIYTPIAMNDRSWQFSGNDPTVLGSFRDYRFYLTTDAKVDLDSPESIEQSLSYEVPLHGRFLIASHPRLDAHQQRPWVRTKSFMTPATADVFTVEAVNIPVEISYGKLGDLPVTRVAETASDRLKRKWTKFYLAQDKVWIELTCIADESDSHTLSVLENIASSLHLARSDEPAVDPFTIDALVARMAEPQASALLRKKGSKAEPALLEHLNDSNLLAREHIIELLGEVGTRDSVEALLPIARGDDRQLTDLARASIRKIAPSAMDDVVVGLLDLASKDFQRRQKGVNMLAGIPVKADDPRRADVASALTDLILDRDKSFGLDADLTGDAIAAWQTPETVPALLPMLNHDVDHPRRELAMTALAKTRDKRAVFPIIRWLIEDTDSASAALATMGPVAEDELIKVLGNKDATARLAACTILSEIGTRKSLKPLDNFVFYKMGPKDAEAGKSAIAIIKERLGIHDKVTQ